MRSGKAITIAYLQFFLLSSIVASCQTDVSKKDVNQTSIPKKIVLTETLDSTQFIYSWKEELNIEQSLINVISPPKGYKRTSFKSTSFAAWLNHIPLSKDNTVYLFNTEKKHNQSAQFKVLDIDVGKRDLQQCADAVMRLRAEYLFATNQTHKIHFNYTNGVNIPFTKWSSGLYPSLKGNKVVWTSSSNNASYKSFKKYLTNVFTYAGTASLEKEMKTVELSDIQAGDVLIKGGFPGHAVIVLEVVANKVTGDKAFVLAQSYMPAQSIHILQNPTNSELSPWYSLQDISAMIETPEWTFYPNQLKRFIE